VTIAALRATLAARWQELPLEAPHANRATLGGTLAANASGPRRLRFGSTRDRILGARYALGDGTLARTGGRVYALHRLMCGSRGGLAAILEASLKLLPAPAARAALVYEADHGMLADAARWADLPRLEPAGLTVAPRAAVEAGAEGGGAHPAGVAPPRAAEGAGNGAETLAVVVGLEENAEWCAEQERRVVAALGRPAARIAGDAVTALWQRLSDLEAAPGPRLTFATSDNTPAGLAPALAAARGARILFHAPAGRLHLLGALPDPQAVVEELSRAGFALIDRHACGSVRPAVEPFDAVRALRARIRAAVDPGGRFALGGRWVESV
jgi:glycolate oxidase FAD binding subunit